MSLSLALSSSISGLALASRGTQVVADNIANAQTEGYAPRGLAQTARVLGNVGSGVQMTGITRHLDAALLADLRDARTQHAQASALSQFWASLEGSLGLPGDTGSLSNNFDALEAALARATASPDNSATLRQAVQAATDLASSLARTSAHLASARDRADAALVSEVSWVNDALAGVADLNMRIQRQSITGGAPEALMDQRQALIDALSDRLGLREIPRQDGRIMLVATDGTVLVDRAAARFDLTRSPFPTADETLPAITLNGRALSATNPLLATGSIAAQLAIRDQHIVEAQTQLDTLAFALITGLSDPALDPSLDGTGYGLFASAVGTVPAQPEAGLASQIKVNPAFETEPWRLRAGAQATAPGPANDNRILARMANALADPALTLPRDALVTNIAPKRLTADQDLAYAAGVHAALSEAFALRGVDTDTELTRLLVLEQAYAANARVLNAVDAMLRTLMEL